MERIERLDDTADGGLSRSISRRSALAENLEPDVGGLRRCGLLPASLDLREAES